MLLLMLKLIIGFGYIITVINIFIVNIPHPKTLMIT